MAAGVTGGFCAAGTGLRSRGQCGACVARVLCWHVCNAEWREFCGSLAEESRGLGDAGGSRAICGGDFFCGHIYPALVAAALMAAPVATW